MDEQDEAGQDPTAAHLFDEEIEEVHDAPDPDDKWDDYDWQKGRRELNLTSEDIQNVVKWIEDAKNQGVRTETNNDTLIHPS